MALLLALLKAPFCVKTLLKVLKIALLKALFGDQNLTPFWLKGEKIGVFLLFWHILFLTNPVFRKKIENVEDKCKYYPPWHKVYGPFHKTSHPRRMPALGIFSI